MLVGGNYGRREVPVASLKLILGMASSEILAAGSNFVAAMDWIHSVRHFYPGAAIILTRQGNWGCPSAVEGSRRRALGWIGSQTRAYSGLRQLAAPRNGPAAATLPFHSQNPPTSLSLTSTLNM